MKPRLKVSLLLFSSLVMCGSAFAQVTRLSVQVLTQNDKTATYRVFNNTEKPLTCYSVAIDVTHNDGAVNHSEASECQYDANGILAPHGSIDRNTNLESSNHSGIAKVEVQPSLAVFQDGSSEAKDDHSWHVLMDSVKSDNDGVHDVIVAIQQFKSQPLKAAATLEPLRGKATAQSPYERQLRHAIAFLKKNPPPDKVKEYLDNLEREYKLHKPYADLRPRGGK